MDFRNSGKFTDRNSILYGHRMNNGTMFADLSNYSNQAFFEEHPYLLIITPEAKYKAEVFSAYVANTTYNSWDTVFDGDEKYMNWLESIQSRSYFNRDVEFSPESRVVTLSTCTYEFEDARFIVHALLHEIE
jgi:sortase B